VTEDWDEETLSQTSQVHARDMSGIETQAELSDILSDLMNNFLKTVLGGHDADDEVLTRPVNNSELEMECKDIGTEVDLGDFQASIKKGKFQWTHWLKKPPTFTGKRGNESSTRLVVAARDDSDQETASQNSHEREQEMVIAQSP
jgi:hypothetical protein